jgi:hypothetical protein
MKYTTSLALVPLLTLGCGSSPAAPTAAPPPAGRVAVGVALQIVPSGVNGFTPPTSVTMRLSTSPAAPATIESASFRMVDAGGQTLTEASLVAWVAGPPDPDQYLEAGTAVQTLRWPAERGVGSRIDVTLAYRDAAGVLASHTFSIPAR